MFVSLFRSFAAANPVKTAVVCHGESISYGEMDAEVRRVSKYLSLMGVERGTRVVVALPNSITYLVLYHALADSGAVMIPLVRDLTLEAITQCLAESQPDFCLVAGELTLPYQQVCSSLGHGQVVSDSTRPFSLAEMARRDPACITPLPRISPDHDLKVHFHWQAGSPGGWCSAVQNHRHHIQRLLSWSRTAGLSAQDRTLCIEPLSDLQSAETLALPALATGQTLYLMDERRVTPEAVTQLIRHEQITLFGASAAFYQRMLDAPIPQCASLNSLRILLCDASGLNENLAPAFLRRFGVRLNYAYSLPQTALALVDLQPRDGQNMIALGRPLFGVEAVIRAGANGLGGGAREDSGELWIRAESFAQRTLAGSAIGDRQGWLATGARVCCRGGCFYFLGLEAPLGVQGQQRSHA